MFSGTLDYLQWGTAFKCYMESRVCPTLMLNQANNSATNGSNIFEVKCTLGAQVSKMIQCGQVHNTGPNVQHNPSLVLANLESAICQIPWTKQDAIPMSLRRYDTMPGPEHERLSHRSNNYWNAIALYLLGALILDGSPKLAGLEGCVKCKASSAYAKQTCRLNSLIDFTSSNRSHHHSAFTGLGCIQSCKSGWPLNLFANRCKLWRTCENHVSSSRPK